jgi:RNA polymerase sigma-70 factor (ECF subfamily)
VSDGAQVRELADGLFRHSAGRIVATLARIFGSEHIELAEDVAQEALLAALERWPFHGVPEDPYAWLLRVAKNFALDRLRRDASLRGKEPEIRAWTETSLASSSHGEPDDGVSDDQLAMIFACCHPGLPADARVALTLKTVCGFGVSEIARAFLADDATIAQRLVRAKRRLSAAGIAIEVPAGRALTARLDSVLEVLYLVFNEGFCAHRGAELVRVDLVDEALRLTARVLREPATATPKTHALFALMLFHAARLAARVDDAGSVLLLAEQDRSLWDRALIARGYEHLRLAATGDELSDLHLEAGIASCHAGAASWSATDWPQILEYYDLLVARNASPVIALNRAVAVAMVAGPDNGLRALDELTDLDPQRYYLLPALRGELLRQLERRDEAALEFELALATGCSEPEQRLLQRKLADCRA